MNCFCLLRVGRVRRQMLWLSWAALLFLTSSAHAADLLVSTNTTLPPGTYVVDNVVVQSGVTLILETNLATGQGVTLEAQSVTVEAGAVISADGKGHPAASGPAPGAAGGYAVGAGGGANLAGGGQGGGSSGGAAGGSSQIAWDSALSAGSGGGNNSGAIGGAGGGVIRIVSSGPVVVHGTIRTNGLPSTNSSHWYAAGGGAAGSIWIEAPQLSGNGLISANGGAGAGTPSTGGRSGGGAGGRVFITADLGGSQVQVQTRGGASAAQAGGAGLVVYRQAGATSGGDFVLHNGGSVGANTPIATNTYMNSLRVEAGAAVAGQGEWGAGRVDLTDGTIRFGGALSVDDTLVATGSSLIEALNDCVPLVVEVAGDASFDSLVRISADGRGFAPGGGPGMGVNGAYMVGGGGGAHAGHGGRGAGNSGGQNGGAAYGDALSPTTCGSPGGSGGSAGSLGGRGGGAIVLRAQGTLDLKGQISANGLIGNAESSVYAGGGGAGGSVVVEAASITGGGHISAHGAAGRSLTYAHGGGGGGGFVALMSLGALNVSTSASGGNSGSQRGGAGLVYTLGPADAFGHLATYQPASGAATPLLRSSTSLDTITISGAAHLHLVDATDIWVLGVVTVEDSSQLTVDTTVQAGRFAVQDLATVQHTAGLAGLRLEVDGDFVLGNLAQIRVDGRGHAGSAGAGAGANGAYMVGGGGAGHGGFGGQASGNSGGAAGGSAQGSFHEVVRLGAGGGSGGSAGSQGGRGGGIVDIEVGGTFALLGRISANGAVGTAESSVYSGGGGAGGAIRIVAGSLMGDGSLEANGGAGISNTYANGGGGSGGRIEVQTSAPSLVSARAQGGGGTAQRGGAGTVLWDFTHLNRLVIQNEGAAGAATPLDGQVALNELAIGLGAVVRTPSSAVVDVLDAVTVVGSNTVWQVDTSAQLGSLYVTQGATITHSAGQSGMHLQVAQGATIDAASKIDVSARGHAAGVGAGAGPAGGWVTGGFGGTHAGSGAGGQANGGVAPAPYGTYVTPAALGSGGGSADAQVGGAGGGAVRLSVGGVLTLEGQALADGANASTSDYYRTPGGGAGGSIWIEASEVRGAGLIRANGGNGAVTGGYQGGGGGGGRIAVSAAVVEPSLESRGGSGFGSRGGAGSIFTQILGHRTLRFDAQGLAPVAVSRLLSGVHEIEELQVANLSRVQATGGAELAVAGRVHVSGQLRFDSLLPAHELTVFSGGDVGPAPGSAGAHLMIAGDLEVQTGGILSGDAAGWAGGSGPGMGANGAYNAGGGGGGYGCNGGAGSNHANSGGAAYGSADLPSDMGSGGGNVNGNTGGRGGGLVRLTVGGTARIDGILSANGGSGTHNGWLYTGGGGGGGSIRLVAGRLAGSGTIRANGGAGGSNGTQGGGGGGGRIALRHGTNTFAGVVQASGGTGAQAGCSGSIVNESAAPSVDDLVAATATATGSIDLVWTEPEGLNPLVHAYDIRFDTSSLDDVTFAFAAPVDSPPVPTGNTAHLHTHTVSGLVGGRTYYFGLRVVGANDVFGELSNITSAAAGGDEAAPAAVSDLRGSRQGGGVLVEWSAPSDEGSGAAAYMLKVAPVAGAFDWDTAASVTDTLPLPGSAGTGESAVLLSLPTPAPGASLWAALRTQDSAGNWSDVSNIARLDLDPPTVSISAPLEGAEIAEPTLWVANATDDQDIAALQWRIGGLLVQTTTKQEPSRLFDPRSVQAGATDLEVRAIDTFGNETTAQVNVVAQPAPLSAPTLLWPLHGTASTSSQQDISGTAASGSSVELWVDGQATGLTADVGGQASVSWQAEHAASNGCIATPSAEGMQIGPGSPPSNMALGKPTSASTQYSSQFASARITDGLLEDGANQQGYWLAPDGVTGAWVQVDLGNVVSIHRVALMNVRNAIYFDRSTRDFRLQISSDGQNFTQIGQGTLTKDDITNWYNVIAPANTTARYVRFIADTFFGYGSGLSEMEVFATAANTSCHLVTGWLSAPDADHWVSVQPNAELNDGSISLEVDSDAPKFATNFAGTAIDASHWTVSPGVTQNDALVQVGTNSWTTRWAYTLAQFDAPQGLEVLFRVRATSQAMVGLRRPGATVSYEGLAHALYFNAGTFHIYEDGSHRGQVGTYSTSAWIEARFTVHPLDGVRTWARPVGSNNWTLLYHRNPAGGQQWQVGVNTYGGTTTVEQIHVFSPQWRPASEVASLDPSGAVRIRATLSRPTPDSVSPVLDALHLVYGSVTSGAGDGSFAFSQVPLADGERTLHVVATSLVGEPSPPSNEVTITIDSTPPAAVVDLALSFGAAQGSLLASWTAPGDDASQGTAASYELRYATMPLTADNFAAGTLWTAGLGAPRQAGDAESVLLTGLTPGTLYYVALRTFDELGNVSSVSNVPSSVPKDTTAPSLSFTAPAANTHHRNVATISVSTSDNVAVTLLRLLVDGVEVASKTSAPWELPWNTAAFDDGPYTLSMVASDAQGNSTTVTRSLFADNTPPELAVAPPSTPTNAPILLDVTSTDNLTPLASLVVRDQANRPAPFLYPLEGAQTVAITSTDLAGNATQVSRSFVVDYTGPAVIADLSATPGQAGEAHLEWTAPADNLTSVQSYQVRYDTGATGSYGDGADAALDVTTEIFVDEVRTPLALGANAGATELSVDNEDGFSVGDEVVVYNAQGQGAGRYEFHRVAQIGAGLLTLATPLAHTYGVVADKVFVQRVPNYTDVRVFAGGRLRAHAWNGQTGGLVVFRATGQVRVEAGGIIDASRVGYRGFPGVQAITCKKNTPGGSGEGWLGWGQTMKPAPLGSGGAGSIKNGTCNDGAGGGGGGHATAGGTAAAFACYFAAQGGLPVGSADLSRLYFGGGGAEGTADEDGGGPGFGGPGAALSTWRRIPSCSLAAKSRQAATVAAMVVSHVRLAEGRVRVWAAVAAALAEVCISAPST